MLNVCRYYILHFVTLVLGDLRVIDHVIGPITLTDMVSEVVLNLYRVRVIHC